jgi:hypothetical protein
MRDKLWAECVAAVIISEISCPGRMGRAPMSSSMEKKPISQDLVEVGIKLSRRYGFPEKLSNSGNNYIFLGYTDDYPGDIFRLLDLKTQQVMLTRNIRWFGKTFGEFLLWKYQNTNSTLIWNLQVKKILKLDPKETWKR